MFDDGALTLEVLNHWRIYQLVDGFMELCEMTRLRLYVASFLLIYDHGLWRIGGLVGVMGRKCILT
jgi:hypothetical protein